MELAIKDAFKESDMTEIEVVLNLLYNTYKKQQKVEVNSKAFQSMKDDFDFEDSGLRLTAQGLWHKMDFLSLECSAQI